MWPAAAHTWVSGIYSGPLEETDVRRSLEQLAEANEILRVRIACEEAGSVLLQYVDSTPLLQTGPPAGKSGTIHFSVVQLVSGSSRLVLWFPSVLVDRRSAILLFQQLAAILQGRPVAAQDRLQYLDVA